MSDAPTPVRRRRYTRKEKLSAVLAADMGGVIVASETLGIPESNIRYWADQPEYAEYRAKAREDLAEEVGIVAHLAWMRVAQALRAGELEPRDALFAADKATTLYQLVSGAATSRSETRDLSALDDHETQALRDWIDSLKVPSADPAV